MKIILKQQNGGSFLPLFADYTILPATKGADTKIEGSSTTVKDKSDPSKGKITEKDLFGMLAGVDGLPNEMQALVQNIKQMYEDWALFGDSDDYNFGGLATLYAQNLAELKIANFNKKEYDKAYTEVEKNKGLNAMAITNSGKIMAYNADRELTQVSVAEYLNNTDKYVPLTNSNLLWLRAHDPQYIKNNQIFQIIENGVGIEKVQEQIKNRLASLGTSESSISGYTSKQSEQIIGGIQVLDDISQQGLAAGMSIDGLYKTKVITKEQAQQAEAALNYIYNTLPVQSQAILQLQAQNAKDPRAGAKALISQLITSQQDSTKILELDLQKDINSDSSKKDKSKKGSGTLADEDLTIATQFLMGMGHHQMFEINPGTNFSTIVPTNSMQIVKNSGDQLGANSTLQEVSESQFGSILDWHNVTMGGRKIDPANLNRVLVSDGMITSVDFPVDENGNPDLRPTTLKAKKEFDQKIAAAGIDMNDPQSRAQYSAEINAIMEECGLNAAYNSEGEIVSGNWKRFAVINGTADNRALGLSEIETGGPMLREVTDEFTIDNLISTLQDKLDIDKLPFDKNDSWFEGDYNSFQEGTVWIPLKVNYFNSQNSKISGKLANELEELQVMRDREAALPKPYVNPGQL